MRCTIQHVVMGECRACDRGVRREALAGMQRALEELDDVITKDGRRRLKTRAADGKWVQEEMGEEEREGRRGEAWARQLEAARGAVDAAAAGREVSKEGWQAVRQVLAGVVMAPGMGAEWGEREAKRRARRAAEVVGVMQDEVSKVIGDWRGATVKARGEYV